MLDQTTDWSIIKLLTQLVKATVIDILQVDV